MNPIPAEFEDLLAAILEGDAGPAQLERLREMMRENPDLIREYEEQSRAHALLEWRAGLVSVEPPNLISIAPKKRVRLSPWLAAAATLALASLFLLNRNSPSSLVSDAGTTVDLEVLEATGSSTGGAFELATGAKLSLTDLQMPPGFFRFRLESGAVVAVTGPADLKFVNPMHLRVNRGKVTADVGDDAKGFIVETAQTRIVDLGTRFGVDVADSGHTDVVVFQGEVELHDIHKESQVNRLVEGEAVRVNFDQQLSRISSITSGPEGDDEWSASDVPDAESVITAVYDNIHNPRSNFYYRILRGGLREDSLAFIAKRHEWNGLQTSGMPSWLKDADLVQTFGGGSQNENLELSLDVSMPSVIYLFVDSRVAAPEWLKTDFENTGEMIGMENAPLTESGIPIKQGPGNGNLAPFSIWKKVVPTPATLKLGPPPASEPDRPHWMYGIAAKRLDLH